MKEPYLSKKFKKQHGAAALEFAFLFMIFFMIFYAIVLYSTLFLFKASFHHSASEGARAAIAVDPQAYPSNAHYINHGVIPRVKEVASTSLSWLPISVKNIVLGENNSNINVSVTNDVVLVKISYPNYIQNPIIPVLNIPGFGPMVPADLNLEGSASLHLS